MIPGLKNSDYQKYFFIISSAGGFIAIVFVSVSVSISQLGLFIAIAGWILLKMHSILIKEKYCEKDFWEMPFIIPHALKASLGIYFVIFVSFIYNNVFSGDSADKLFRSEFRDVFLMSMAFWIISYASDARGRDRIYKWIAIALAIAIITGFISIFSKYRLSKIPYHFLHGWEATRNIRFQHHAGTLFIGSPLEVHLYVPIGFMNTHLTYAAILSLFLPAVFFSVIHRFITGVPMRFKLPLVAGFAALIAACMILILNNGRSAILGLIFSLVIGLYYYTRNYWGKKILKIIYPSLFLAILFAGMSIFSLRLGERFEHLMDSLEGKSKITDYQRYFLWQAALEVVSERPLLGVGPGNFQSSVEEKILQYSVENPSLWYDYSVIQRGHAHNDTLHLQTIAGIFAVIFYIIFFYLLLYELLRSDRSIRESWWIWGAMVIFPAGLFQCYFQDDEVLLPFWVLAGLILSKNLSGEVGNGEGSESEKN